MKKGLSVIIKSICLSKKSCNLEGTDSGRTPNCASREQRKLKLIKEKRKKKTQEQKDLFLLAT